MKEQRFIVYLLDEDGKQVGFERFSCKRVSTVKKQMLELWQSSLYRACTKGAKEAHIYPTTPNGTHTSPAPASVVVLEL